MATVLGYVVLTYAVLMFVFLLFVQHKLGALLEAMNQNLPAFGLSKAIPDWYFPVSFIQMNYAPVRALQRTVQPPLEVVQAFPNYQQLRYLACTARLVHVGLGLAIVLGFVLTRV